MHRLIHYSPLFFLLFLLLVPKTAAQGAYSGLVLWSRTLVPILLPFLIFSNLMLTRNLTAPINRLLSPFLCRILPIGRQACYPLLLGLFCGMPLGAKTTARLYQLGALSLSDAIFLLGFANQASLGFLVSYIAATELNASVHTILILSVVYLSAFLVALSFRSLFAAQKQPSFCVMSAPGSLFSALDDSITDSFNTILKIGGYITLFSVLSACLDKLPLPEFPRLLLCGISEITSGIHSISSSTLSGIQKAALTMGVTAFGGLSGIMQTISVTLDTGLPMKYYFYMKTLQGFLCYFLTLALLHLFY